jgi:S-adenosylmethionine:tRNA ribosyltransferase-isomerase
MEFAKAIARYDYTFPPELIATAPAHPRDNARLAVFDRASGDITFSTFHKIGKFLPEKSVLVLNETKVIPARLHLTRTTGGKVAVLSLGVTSHGLLRVLSPKKLREGEYLQLHGKEGFTVKKSRARGGAAARGPEPSSKGDQKEWLLEANFPLSKLQKEMEKFGTMPLPPYIKHTPLTEKEIKREYQSVFAKDPGSIAAPTASLHFTKKLLSDLQKHGHRIIRVTLHVHLGTFSPLTEEQWKSGKLHTEEYHIAASAAHALEKAKSEKRKIIAVGTTVARTLESASDQHGRISKPSGTTNLFIREGYQWKMVNGLITNFHVPKSSLLMLVSAYAGREQVMELYKKSIEQRMRLFSFGDGMLIL